MRLSRRVKCEKRRNSHGPSRQVTSYIVAAQPDPRQWVQCLSENLPRSFAVRRLPHIGIRRAPHRLLEIAPSDKNAAPYQIYACQNCLAAPLLGSFSVSPSRPPAVRLQWTPVAPARAPASTLRPASRPRHDPSVALSASPSQLYNYARCCVPTAAGIIAASPSTHRLSHDPRCLLHLNIDHGGSGESRWLLLVVRCMQGSMTLVWPTCAPPF